LEDNKLKIKKF